MEDVRELELKAREMEDAVDFYNKLGFMAEHGALA